MALQNFGINDTTSVALKFELCAAHTFVWPLHKKRETVRCSRRRYHRRRAERDKIRTKSAAGCGLITRCARAHNY